MYEHDHWIFFAGLDFHWRHYPSLNIKSFVRPLDAFGFSPRGRERLIAFGKFAPFPDRAAQTSGGVE